MRTNVMKFSLAPLFLKVKFSFRKHCSFSFLQRGGRSVAVWFLMFATEAVSTPSGLPVPRFVSLKSSDVNLRVGPGDYFPTQWVYKRANLPVEIVAEFGDWRQIREVDRTQGWVHKSLLSGHRFVTILHDKTPLHASEETASKVLATLQNGVLGMLLKCKENACYIHVRGEPPLKGWVLKEHLWGLEAKE